MQPPPLQSLVFSSSFQKSKFVPSPTVDGEFIPFVPNYQKVPTNIRSTKVPFSSTTKDYFTTITTFRPIIPNLRQPNKLKHTVDYYRHENLMLPQHTHIINHKTSSIQISNPNINLSTASTTSTPMYSDNSKEEENKSTTDYSEFNDHFGPPSSYFDTKNKYENIENPFASPEFDFDKFLAGLRNEHLVPKIESKQLKKLEPNLKSTSPPKNTQPNEYYYYEYEEEDDDSPGMYETNDAPKKIYSSQIKPTIKVVPKTVADYYYEDEYDYPQKKISKSVNVSKNGEVKYSSKYQGKPLKLIITTQVPQTTSISTTTSVRPTNKKNVTRKNFTFSSTIITTLKPNFTTRQRLKLTLPTDDDKKLR